MGRLIEADSLIEELNKLAIKANDLGEYSATNFIINLVKNRPTAYDVEKVVAELKEHLYTDYTWTDFVEMEDAINIVKRGGVE